MKEREGSPARTRVLALEGEFDVRTTNEAHKRLLALDLPRGGRLAVDLGAVTFMDSTGIRLPLQAREHARRCGASYVLVSVPPAVMRVLELVGLEEQLDIVEPDLAPAPAAAGGGLAA